MTMTRQGILDTLERNMPAISRLGIQRIALFGSYARGTQTEESDIDLLVEFRENEKSFDSLMELKVMMERLMDKPVDIILANRVKRAMKEEIFGSAVYAQAS